MNCRDVTPLLSAERDGPLDAAARETLERHVAACPACRGLRADLAEAAEVWRAGTALATTPDPAGEWRTLRGRLHSAGETNPAAGRRLPSWLLTAGALPLAAAAVWLAMLALDPASTTKVGPPSPVVAFAKSAQAPSARADYVETPADTTPVVYLDQESGWLIVWAEPPAPRVSG
jgi:anti-sigma factor RsiW